MTDQNQPAEPVSTTTLVSLAPLYAALAKAQGEFLPITRSRTVEVQPKKREDGSWPKPYTFDYAPLEEVKRATTPALSKYGLALFHRLSRTAGCPVLVTVLAHESGAAIEDTIELPKGLEGQQLGSATTYATRYATNSILGVAAEYDDDGNGADGNGFKPVDKGTRPTPPPVTPPAEKKRDAQASQPKGGATAKVEPAAVVPPMERTYDIGQGGKVTETTGQVAKPASVPPPAKDSDADYPDTAILEQGAPIGKRLSAAFRLVGVSTDDRVELTRRVTEMTGKRLGEEGQLLTYGDARLMIQKLSETVSGESP